MSLPILPPYLKPGDLLRVIAPSGALREMEAFHQSVEIWKA
ncbi:MAG: LD-carboxypeptidase, partial [Dolichospermum sp.]